MKSLLFFLSLSLAAQTLEIGSLYSPAPLTGVWMQQQGDHTDSGTQSWADHSFDDATWTRLSMPRSSRPGPLGVTLYRIHIHLPEPLPAEPLALLIGPLFPAYEVFVNGKPVGRFGGPIGNRSGQRFAEPVRFALPKDSNLLIAIRSEDWQIPFGAQSASAASSQSWIGTESSIANLEAAWKLERLRRNEPVRLIMVLVLGGAMFFITLSLWRRRADEYLWFGCFLLQNGLFRVLQTTPEWLGSPSRETANLVATLNGFVVIGLGVMIARPRSGSRPNSITWLIVLIDLVLSLSTSFPGC